MGKHSTPLDGVAIKNGHAPSLAPFTISPQIEVRQGGPVAPWPQPEKDPWWRGPVDAVRAVVAHRAWLAAVPVVLVNAVAFYGQLAFLRVHLDAPPGVQVLVAVALESIAVYLAWQAHLAQLADDSALRLRLAAYGTAALIAAMNYSHYAGLHWQPTFAAVAFALCSAISPWLWSVHSRRVSRDALKAKGLIEPHAVRLGGTRWAFHLIRSARVMSRATWKGETDPVKAIAMWQPKVKDDAPADVKVSPAPALKVAASPDAPESPAEAPSSPPRSSVKTKPRKRTTQPSPRTKALAILKAEPGVTVAEVMKRTGASKSTVERARAELNGASS